MRTTAVVIGAGQAGLAMSWWLAARSIDHVVLERGEVANTWRTERWDSLTLLTPNWQSRLPGHRYEGDDPDGFRTMQDTIAFIERYASLSSVSVRTHCPVTSVRSIDDGYQVVTQQGAWRCKAVVLPPARSTSRRCRSSRRISVRYCPVDRRPYRDPACLEAGGVMVVGTAAVGCADR